MKAPIFSLLLLASSIAFAENPGERAPSQEQKLSVKEENLPITVQDESHLPLLSAALQNRQMAKLKLTNGLCVYLISDTKADQSAAALSVHAGSWNDPQNYPGMAHFLEHMLFQGTTAYPDPAEYMRFIWDHGGTPNAFTGPDRTVYMFSINHSSFVEALDRFSHFFTDPLFNPAQIKNELFAVDQEYGKNIEEDEWRKYYIFKEMGNSEHPNAQFSIGNSSSLNNIPQEEMKKWHETFYSANLMNLVVYSPLPLETLKEMIVEKFQKIPNKKTLPFSNERPLSSQQQKGHLVYISPIQKKEHLTLLWELPKNLVHEESKAAELIAYTLKRGNPKSLLEYLKKEGLAENLDVQNDKIGNLYDLFSIEIDLTEKGIAQLSKVIQASFEALATLKESSLPVFLFDEMCTMQKIGYQYQERVDAFLFVKNHATQLLDEDLATYPSKTLLPSHYDPEALAQVLQALSAKECQYCVTASPSLTHVEPKKKEKWLGGEYAIVEISPSELSSWENAKPQPQIQLPTPNAFIPTHLSLINGSSATEEMQKTKKMIEEEKGKLFFIAQNVYLTPTIDWILRIKTPILDGTTTSFVSVDLYLQMIQDKLQPLLQTAKEGGLDLSLHRNGYFVELLLDGYSEKALPFLKEFLESLKNSSFTQEDFDRSYLSMKREYENTAKALPLWQARELQNSLLSPSNRTSKERAQSLKEISLTTIQELQKKILSSLYLEALLSGNMNESDAQGVWKMIQETLSYEPFPVAQHPKKQVLHLAAVEKPMQILQPTDALGNGVILTLAQGDFSFPARSSQQVLSLALKEAFFTSLRSKQKTAYIAKSWEEEIEKQLFHSFAVQSSSHNVFDLLYRFEFFIEDFFQNISQYIPETRFSSLKQDLITQLSMPPKNLSELAFRQTKLAFDYQEDFDWIEKNIAALKELSYKDFLSFVQNSLSYQNKGRLALLYEGRLLQEENVSYAATSASDLLKTSHYVTAPKKEEESLQKEETAAEEIQETN